ncbi:hypothetical protein C8R43DRAFT_406886 [Mycena crocata]|nr:hypothetical protein C8R43DRAFT_406886 [Mycena crocata]
MHEYTTARALQGKMHPRCAFCSSHQVRLSNVSMVRVVQCLSRKLDLANVESLDILASLLSLLKSLEWLDLDAEQVDHNLLATVNSHPNLTTLAVRDPLPDVLRDLASSTSLSLRKLLFLSVVSDCSLTLRCPTLHALMSRHLRLAHLILRDETNIKRGAGTLSLPGLEKLDIYLYYPQTSLMSWLPAFAERHTSLNTIKFIGDMRGSIWRSNADLQFPLQFIDAMEREALTLAAALSGFTISRTRTASSLNDWEVSALEMTMLKAAGVAALGIASKLVPRTSSLAIRMPRLESSQLIHVVSLNLYCLDLH